MASARSSTFVLLCALAVVPSYGYAQYTHPGIMDDRWNRICYSDACNKTAKEIQSAMDLAADPCNDFYQFACGGWIEQNPIPDDHAFYSQFHVAAERIEVLLRDRLECTDKTDRSAVRKAKIFYRSCLNESISGHSGVDSIVEVMQQLGALQVLGSENSGTKLGGDEYFRIESYLGMTKIFKDVSPIINFDVRVDDTNSTRPIIALDQPRLIMPSPEYYISPVYKDVRVAYIDFLTMFLEELANIVNQVSNVSKTHPEDSLTSAQQILSFETDLAAILSTAEQRMDLLNNFGKTSVRRLARTVSSDFRWMEYISEVVGRTGIDVSLDTEIAIYSEEYLKLLPNVLKRYQPRIIKDYIVSSTLISRIHAMPASFRTIYLDLRKAIIGTTADSEPWKRCVRIVGKSFPLPLASMYVQNHFPQKSSRIVNEMVDNIILNFGEMLRDNPWMDNETKKKALVKVTEMEKLIGYPTYIVDESDPKLDQEFEGVEIVPGKFFKNDVQLQKFFLQKSLRKLNRLVEEDSWAVGPVDIDAYYDRNSNILVFPAGVLQPPFFDPAKPFAMVYGGIGNAIAHEVTHGFDTSGSRFDEIGNLVNWWSNSSRTKFEEASDCFKKQYNEFYYKDAGMFVNGNITVDENIADNGGIWTAYQAYRAWSAVSGDQEFTLPGFEEFSPSQLFFLATAQTWCSKERTNFAKKVIEKFSHSPPLIRFLHLPGVQHIYNVAPKPQKVFKQTSFSVAENHLRMKRQVGYCILGHREVRA